MSTESRAQAALRNSLWNVIGYVVPTLIALFVTPAVVLGLGTHEYGVYAFLLGLIAILGVMDLGFTIASSRLVTEYFRSGQKDRLASLMATSHTVGLAIGSIGFLASLVVGSLAHLTVVGTVSPETVLMFGIVGAIFFVNSLNFPYMTVPGSLERFDIASGISVAVVTTSSMATLVLVKMGYGLTPLLLVQLAASLATNAAYIYSSKRLLGDPRAFSFAWSKEEVAKCYSFGIRVFAANLGSTALSNLARLIVPVYLNPTALTYYSVPGNITNKIPGLMQSLSTVLFPMTAHLTAAGETEKVKAVYIRSFRLMTVASAAIALSVALFSDRILRIWIDESFAANSTHVIMILAAASFFLALFGPISNFLTGLGKVDMLKNASLSMAALNAALLAVLLPLYGIEGAAWAFLGASLMVGYMVYHTERHYLGMGTRAGHYAKLALKLCAAGAATWILAALAFFPFTRSLFTLVAFMSASIAAFVSFYWLFGFFEKEDIADMRQFAARIARKLKP